MFSRNHNRAPITRLVTPRFGSLRTSQNRRTIVDKLTVKSKPFDTSFKSRSVTKEVGVCKGAPDQRTTNKDINKLQQENQGFGVSGHGTSLLRSADLASQRTQSEASPFYRVWGSLSITTGWTTLLIMTVDDITTADSQCLRI